jgi:hypothetical protein
MPTVPAGPPPGSADEDDFDRQLRELAANAGQPAQFVEPSAAERALRPVQSGRASRAPTKPARPGRPGRTAPSARRRESRRARQLRAPVLRPGQLPAPSPWRRSVTRLRWRVLATLRSLVSRSVLIVTGAFLVLCAMAVGLDWLSTH